MTEERKPREPKIERKPAFSARVNPGHRSGQLENPAPLDDDPEADEGLSVEDDRTERETTRTTSPIAPVKPAEH